MKNVMILGVLAATILLAGCGKKEGSSGGSAPPPQIKSDAAPSPTPISQPALTAWQQGDKAGAISSFLATDWSARPLFAPGSTLSLSEDQFKALSNADREAKSAEMMAQVASLKQMAAAVAQTARDTASKGDSATARKNFTSLKQFGAALDTPDNLSIVQLVGRAFKKSADQELAKIP